MDVTVSNPPRTFRPAGPRTVVLKDCARIVLEPDEQVTFHALSGAQYDVVRKDWGYYATPSLNGRLPQLGLRPVLVSSAQGKYYIMLVEPDRKEDFERYLEAQCLRVVTWLDDGRALRHLEDMLGSDRPEPVPDAGERLTDDELRPQQCAQGKREAFLRDVERLKKRRDEFVRVDCPACGSRQSKRVFEKYTFEYRACTACRTVFMSPRPSPQAMADYYADSEDYRFWCTHVFPASEPARREKIHRPRLERIVDACRRYSVGRATLMEIGAGFGTFCSLARETGAFDRVVAVEPMPDLARACRERGLTVIDQPVEKITDERGSVDVAVAFEVIEHLFDPRVLMDQCARMIVPGGLLALTCPNGEGFDIAMLGATSGAIHPGHVNLFNPASLSLLAETCGFEVLEVGTPGRLDAEMVRKAVREGEFDISKDWFLQRVLVEQWDRLGWPFQRFLAEHGLSSHMWLVARRRETTSPLRGRNRPDSFGVDDG